jgi:signal transduction histidine kinase
VSPERLERDGHMGLAGMRERISALGGSVRFGRRRDGGAALEVLLPVVPTEAP